MKLIYTFFLLFIFIDSYSQFYIEGTAGANGALADTKVFVSEDAFLYVEDFPMLDNSTTQDFMNRGIFEIENGTDGELILNAGFDNVGGKLIMNDGILKFGDGNSTRSVGNHNVYFNDFNTTSVAYGEFYDTVKFVEFDKYLGTLDVKSGQLGILETFTSAGNGILEANDHMALVSTSFDNTAIVPESSGGTVKGMRVQRFIAVDNPNWSSQGYPYYKSLRAWHHLTVPVSPSGPIKEDWQEGGSHQNLIPGTPGDALNPHPGYGTHITGSGDGFDINTTGEASLFKHNNNNATYEVPNNTDFEKLELGKGYLLLVRGDRSIDLTINDYSFEDDVILQTTGTLEIGPHQFSGPSSSVGILIGNPYQAPVSMFEVMKDVTAANNIDKTNMWVWEPKAGFQPNLGQYVNFDPSKTSSGTLPGTNVNNILQPGQAVFVQKNDPAASYTLDFKESHKVDASELTEIFNDETPELDGWLRFGLYQPSAIPFQSIAKDGFILKFDNTFSNAINQEDARKTFAFFENMAMIIDNTYLTKNARQLPTNLDEIIPLYIENLRTGEYNFSVELENLSEQLPDGIILWDKYEDSYTELTDQLIVPFNVDTSIPESNASDRFAFVFQNTTLSNEDNVLNGVALYPNPVITNSVNIKFTQIESDKTHIEIFDKLGKRVYSKGYNNNGSEIEINNLDFLSSGVYILKVKQDLLEASFKIIKR